MCVDGEDQYVGFGDGHLGLFADFVHEVLRCLGEHAHRFVAQWLERFDAAGIDERECDAVPLTRRLDAIASGTGLVGDDRQAFADESIEKGAFADVRATYEGDDGFTHK